jgi:hypothetical protein
VLERTIARLEGFQVALSKGVGAWAVSRKR